MKCRKGQAPPTMNKLPLLGIVLLYLIVAGAYAAFTPDWQTPDEPAHYNYVRQIAEEGRLPVITAGDWDRAYLTTLTSGRFAPELLAGLDQIEYEDHQPPLYYLLAAPVYALTGGSLFALRLLSVGIGLGIVLAAHRVGRSLYPERPGVALGAAAFVAFWPQHLVFLAAANNDALGWAVVGIGLWAALAFLDPESRLRPAHLGIIVGVALLTKATAYFLAAVLGAAVVLRWWRQDRRDGRALLRAVALFLLPALVLGGAWWLRNIQVYGFPDFLGLGAHDAVVADQPRTSAAIAEAGFGAYLRDAAATTLRSFFSQAGWMALPLAAPYYLAGYGATLLLLAGALRGGQAKSPQRRPKWLLLWLTIALAALAYGYYNTEFLQLQGRYMFPLLIPLGVLVALGVDGWRSAAARLAPRAALAAPHNRPAWYAAVPDALWLAPFALLALFDVWLLWRVIVPNLR